MCMIKENFEKMYNNYNYLPKKHTFINDII